MQDRSIEEARDLHNHSSEDSLHDKHRNNKNGEKSKNKQNSEKIKQKQNNEKYSIGMDFSTGMKIMM
eukprot:15900271-Heterocapsa_arctica.AAC.1